LDNNRTFSAVVKHGPCILSGDNAGLVQIRNLDKGFAQELPDIQAVGGPTDQNTKGCISTMVVFELNACPYIFCGT